MTDRELLELASKAAGIAVDWRESVKCLCYSSSPYNVAWSPLTDDGDALRLAVKLNLLVNISGGRDVIATDGETDAREYSDGRDIYTATRRAIVRAAAAIGGAA